MTLLEWAIFYTGGLLVGVFGWLMGKPETITAPRPKYRALVHVLCVVFWPIILPFSFAALTLNICYLFHWLSPGRYNPCSWVVRRALSWLDGQDGGFYMHGRKVSIR
jgi:hypothetical protein